MLAVDVARERPCACSSITGFLLVLLNLLIQRNASWTSTTSIVALMIPLLCSLGYGITALIVHRRITSIYSYHGLRFQEAPQVPAIPDDEAQRQQLLRLLLKRTPNGMPTVDMRQDTYVQGGLARNEGSFLSLPAHVAEYLASNTSPTDVTPLETRETRSDSRLAQYAFLGPRQASVSPSPSQREIRRAEIESGGTRV